MGSTNWYRIGFDEGRLAGNIPSPPNQGIRAKADYTKGFNDARKLGLADTGA